MADIDLNRRGHLYTISASGLYNLGTANESGVGSMMWQTIGSGFTGSFLVKKRIIGLTEDAHFIAVQAAREGDTEIIDANTANTADDIYACFADGCQVALDITVSAGSLGLIVWGGKG